MELRTLGYFVAVAEEGTVVAAAERVRVTQPALSRQVRQLERELGVTLFDRHAGRLTLSSAGRALLPLAQDLLGGAADLRRAAATWAHGRMPTVGIAAPGTTLTDVVSPFIASLQPADPTPEVIVSDGLQAEEAVRRGADLVIALDPLGPAFTSTLLARLPVLAYVRDDHPRAPDVDLPLADLADEEVVTLPRHFGVRRALESALADAGLRPLRVAVEASNGTIAQALAAGGRGVAVVSDDPRYGLVPLPVRLPDGDLLRISLHAGRLEQHPGADVLDDLTRRLARWVEQRYPAGGLPDARPAGR